MEVHTLFYIKRPMGVFNIQKRLHPVGPREIVNVCSGTGWKRAKRGKSHPLGPSLGKFLLINIVTV